MPNSFDRPNSPDRVKRTTDMQIRLEVIFGVKINGGLYNAMKKLTGDELKLFEDYVGKVYAEARGAGIESVGGRR